MSLDIMSLYSWLEEPTNAEVSLPINFSIGTPASNRQIVVVLQSPWQDLPLSKHSNATSSNILNCGSIDAASAEVIEKNGASKSAGSSFNQCAPLALVVPMRSLLG